jgi:drug/metabolite transporter (DMT)-like permease
LKHPRNWILFALLVFFWSSGWSTVKLAVTEVGPLNVAFHRFALSALALSPLLVYVGRKMPKDKRTLRRLLLLGAVNASVIVPMYWGLVYETAGVGAVLTYTQPIFVFCLCVLFLKSETTWQRLVGVFLGFFGVVVLSVGSAGFFQGIASPGVFLLILGAFLWAVTILYYKRSLSHVDPILTSVVQQALGAIFVGPLAFFVEGVSFPLTRSYLMLILYLSIFVSGMAVCLWLFLLREEDVTVLSSSSYLIPMVAVFLGWLLLREDVRPTSLLGMGLILVGLYITNRPGS